METAPIALFVYNRPDHTRRTLRALRSNHLAMHSDLYVFCDGPKTYAHQSKVEEVRAVVRATNGFSSISIIEKNENLGLASSIIDGVTSIVRKHGTIIVLEDDMVTSPQFLEYMNAGLQNYRSCPDVASIHGYVYPIDGLPDTFFLRGADCWGWATWEDRWRLFEPNGLKLLNELERNALTERFDFFGTYPFIRMLKDQIAGKNDSWAIRWHASAFLSNKLTLYPGRSFVENIGIDGSGVHCHGENLFVARPVGIWAGSHTIKIEESIAAVDAFREFFQRNMPKPSIANRLLRRLRQLL
jgi:hypothetical protein